MHFSVTSTQVSVRSVSQLLCIGCGSAASEVRDRETFTYLDPLLTTPDFNQYMADSNPP